jgi:hypothetical protein
MTNTRLALFLDTNCFLQLRDFEQIAWRELFPEAKQIALFVCSAVISELDKHKTSTNQRRRNRARKALGLIEAAADASEMRLPIRTENPNVELAIWRGRPVWSDFPSLDERNPDDYLVVAAATDPQGTVLSYDTGPRIRARMVGVRAACPADGWLLPVEQTDDQRKIGQLTRELEAARNARPRLEVLLPNDDPVTMTIVSVPYLGPSAIRDLAARTLAQFPMKHVQATNYSDRYSVLSDPFAIGQTRVDAYHDEYEQFQSAVRTYYTTLHEKVSDHALAQFAPGIIQNVGSVSAKNLTIVIVAEGAIEIMADRDDAELRLGSISLPKPPEPPRARTFYDAGQLIRPPKPRDPMRFYWRERPQTVGSTQSSLECADFRPGCEYNVGVLIYAGGDLPSTGTLSVSASAEHHETVTAKRMFTFRRETAGWLDPLVQSLLPDPVRIAFAEIDAAQLPDW